MGWRIRRVTFLEKEGWGLTAQVLFSEHPLGASVEIAADGAHQKYIFLFMLSLVPWRNLDHGHSGDQIKVHFCVITCNLKM